MTSSVLLPSKLPSGRRASYQYTPAAARRPAVTAPPLKSFSTTPAGGMDSRYYRPPSPRGRFSNPGRASTGILMDPYHDPYYTSPRSSAERIAGHPHTHTTYTYAPGTTVPSRSSKSKYDTYTGRPRSNTHGEHDDHAIRTLQPTTSIPIRTHGGHHLDSPSSPLARSWDSRAAADTFITYAPSRREHKRIYSVDDNHSSKLIAEVEPPKYESGKSGYSSTAPRSSHHYHYNKPFVRTSANLNDDDYSYTDPASMYRDTEPVWRRPRAGSMERGSRPSSLYVEKGSRASTRDQGPPPTTRGLDKINSGLGRKGSLREPPRSSSWDRSGDGGRAREESYSSHPRSSRHTATTVHQEPREPRDSRRDTYHDDYDRRDRDTESKRHSGGDRFEDREVTSRGFGIRTGDDKFAREESLDRKPIWNAHEVPRARPDARSDEYGGGYYPSEDPRLAPETRMPEPPRAPEPRIPRDRDSARYEERPRDRDRDRRERDVDDRGYARAAVPVAGAAAAYSAVEATKSHHKEHDSDRDRELDRRSRDDRYEDDERRRRHHRGHSSDESNDERPRHYVDRDVGRDDPSRKPEPALDPDEEYRRRIQQEQERARKSTRDRDRDHSDSDRERDHRRRDRDRYPESEGRSRSSPNSNAAEPALSRYGDRSVSSQSQSSHTNMLDQALVQEPDSLPPNSSSPSSSSQSKSLQIVTAPKDPPPQPKSILRKPTEKFPEDPEPIREGVAPHKSALKGKDIPPDARWTKIDRRLVNPEALEEAKERFEERMDCVIVLRVLTKGEIQKLADRTKEIREAREEEYERSQRRERRRLRRDEEDRDHDDSWDSEEEEERERERERERGRRGDTGRMIESGR